MCTRLGDHGMQGTDGRLGAHADRTRPGDVGAQLRHLDVVRDILEPPTNNIGHEYVHSVAADVDSRQPHVKATLESP